MVKLKHNMDMELLTVIAYSIAPPTILAGAISLGTRDRIVPRLPSLWRRTRAAAPQMIDQHC
jgi:hypothetical protein